MLLDVLNLQTSLVLTYLLLFNFLVEPEHEAATSNGSAGPLGIAIVGAGIGGVTAAIGLRRNGHIVHLYEKSSLANEFGAAVGLYPNGTGILRAWGIFAETFGANSMSRFVEYARDGSVLREFPEPNWTCWKHPSQLVYRVALHEGLKQIATSPDGPGIPAKLFTSSKVVAVNPEQGTVTLENGTVATADVVVGADGVYSTTRKYICDTQLVSSGQAAFRFMIPRSTAEADPVTAPLVKNLINTMSSWSGGDRRLVMYPCNDNQLLNFACIHPESESHAVQSDEWNKQASLDQVLKVYDEFDPSVKALLAKADPSTIKVWQLMDMDKPPTWVSGKLALLGDAAHPFTPHIGQGAVQAIEDAAALSVVLPPSTPHSQICERLKLYESIRYERAHKIQHASRMTGQDRVDGKPEVDMLQLQEYLFDPDEIAHATAALEQWERSNAADVDKPSSK